MFRSVLTVLVVSTVLALSADAQNSGAEDETEPLRFLLIQYHISIPYRIESKRPDGSLGIRIHLSEKMSRDLTRSRMSRQTAIAMASWLTEGYFLGFGGLPESDNPMAFEDIRRGAASAEDLKMFRVEVKEIGEAGEATVRVGPGAARRLAVGDSFVLIRPAGSTTSQLRATPDFLPVADGRGELVGMNSRSAASLARSVNNAKQIALAMHNFHDTHKCFPPAVCYGPDGKPWHSWRVLLLPYLEQQALYGRYRLDEPWDGLNNKQLLKEVPPVYRDPIYGASDDTYTNYAVAVGTGTAFPAEGHRFDDLNRVLGPNMGRAIRDIRDGTSNTILVGSVSPDRKIPWTKPEDVVFDDDFPGIGKKGGFAAPYKAGQNRGGVFARADGSVTTIRSDIDMNELRNLIRIADGQLTGKIPTLRPQRRGRSEQALVLEISPGAASAKLLMKDLFSEE